MTVDAGTKPLRSSGLPLRGIRIEVIAGPDRGRVASSDEERITLGSAPGNDVVLADPTVSRFHLALERRQDRILVIDHGSTNGTRVGPALLEGSAVSVAPGSTVILGDTTVRVDDGRVVMVDVPGGDGLGGLRGRAPAMRRLFASIERVAPQDVGLLCVGESGTGKELVARAIHDLSQRADKPYVTVDCGALPPSLFAAELFGYEPGAFTGAARSHAGALERANGGTLFLDEIGELPRETQAALLGCLERRRIVRLGGSREIAVDIRVVAATNRDLLREVNTGQFRLDLFYRLAVVKLTIVALRDRPQDIPLLIEHFLREAGHEGPVDALFSASAIEELKRHGWPGNVRELRNLVAATLATGSHMPEEPATPPSKHGDGTRADALLDGSYKDARNTVLHEFERQYLGALLERSDGSVRRAAREAKMDRSYLTELLKRHGMR